MSDYAVHFWLSSTAQQGKKLNAALDGAVEERGLATVRAFAIRYKSAPAPRYWLWHCWTLCIAHVRTLDGLEPGFQEAIMAKPQQCCTGQDVHIEHTQLHENK